MLLVMHQDSFSINYFIFKAFQSCVVFCKSKGHRMPSLKNMFSESLTLPSSVDLIRICTGFKEKGMPTSSRKK